MIKTVVSQLLSSADVPWATPTCCCLCEVKGMCMVAIVCRPWLAGYPVVVSTSGTVLQYWTMYDSSSIRVFLLDMSTHTSYV